MLAARRVQGVASLLASGLPSRCRLRPLGPLPRVLLPGPQDHRPASHRQPASTMSASEAELRGGGVIPDVVDGVETSGGGGLRLRYGSKAAEGGVELKPSQAAHAPSVEVKGDDGPYTLLATDPDAPSPSNPSRREWLHWMVTNIPGGGGVERGKQVVPYMGPAPPEGVHRYVFMLFKQPSAGLEVEAPKERAHFNTRRFAAQHQLGHPVALQYFTAKPE